MPSRKPRLLSHAFIHSSSPSEAPKKKVLPETKRNGNGKGKEKRLVPRKKALLVVAPLAIETGRDYPHCLTPTIVFFSPPPALTCMPLEKKKTPTPHNTPFGITKHKK